MNNPTVAVVIPFFDGSRWIERALESVAKQTRAAEAVIVVDDGSTVEHSKNLRELQSKFTFTILTQDNKGQSSARNFGVKVSESDFVCLLDQDDYFLPNHIEDLLAAADVADPSFSFSYGDLMRVSETGEIISRNFLNAINRHPLTDVTVMLRHNMYILPSATLIKRSAFMEVGGFDESLRGFEEDDFFLRLHLSGYGSRFISKEVTAWTVNSASTSFSEDMCRSRFLYFSKLYKYFSSKENFDFQGSDKVFGNLLFPRFSVNFANDVVASSLGGGLHHLERVKRLKRFRQIVRRDKSLKITNKWTFQIATLPLVTLGRGFQGVLLTVLIRILGFTGNFGIHSLKEFMRLHSGNKEFIDKSLWVSN